MITIRTRELFALLSIGFLLTALSAQAAEPVTPETSDAELVKHAQNPIANLISVPLQNNWYFGTGKKSRTHLKKESVGVTGLGVYPDGKVENGIMASLDWLPTFVAAAGNPNIGAELLKGKQLGDTTYKVTLTDTTRWT